MNTNILNSYREFENARKYWESKLEGDINELKIPTDYPKTNDCIRAHFKMDFDGELSGKLLAFSKNQGLLLYIIMMAGLKVLLYKYTGQEDIIVASPVYNEEEIEKLNKYIVLRDSLKEEMPFKDLLMNVKQTVSEGYKNQHYPVEKLIEQIEDNSGSLLMIKVALSMEGIHKKESHEDILSSSLNYFNFSVIKEENKISVRTTYNSCLFKEDSIKVLCTRFENVLKQAIGDLNRKLKDFSIITEEEKRKILFDFNNTTADYPHDKTIHQLFEEQAAKTPDNIAVVFKDNKLTYMELNKEANRLANYLIAEHCIRPDTLVGLFVENSIEQIIAILGILKAGGHTFPYRQVCLRIALKQ